MEASKEHYEALKDFQLNDAPDIVLDALYSTYKSRTYSCCLRFFCCCCVPGIEEFTAQSLRNNGDAILADVVEALEKVRVKDLPSQRVRAIQSNPKTLLQGEIDKTKAIINKVKKGTEFHGLHEDYINAITALQDPIFELEDSKEHEEGESLDSFDHDF